jgi:hypothetical protein
MPDGGRVIQHELFAAEEASRQNAVGIGRLTPELEKVAPQDEEVLELGPAVLRACGPRQNDRLRTGHGSKARKARHGRRLPWCDHPIKW